MTSAQKVSFCVLSGALVAAACATVSRQVRPAAPDAGVPHVVGDCHPTPGAPGNAKHVGAYCARGGAQCSRFPSGTANKCAADLDERGGNFCVKIFCHRDADCGDAACCYGEPGGLGKACIPAGCLSDAGVCPSPNPR